MRTKDPKTKSTTEIIFEAVQDLYASEQLVTRETLADVTGIKLGIIDDRLGHLVDIGRVRRVQRGVYVPMEHHAPARAITRTLLPDGGSILEIGDEVLQLTPREARLLGELMAGAGQQYASVRIGLEAEQLASAMAAKMRELERSVRALESSSPLVGLEGAS
ncbi:hypothetical protein [Parazoarcus communis]|uniref:Uncharacterized protein n=1 Tax=Parazoarcus communis SWub3 = DSM 12120 TaxID=1121029 RepID=A0A323URI1_9RHOO|nr:hypothetical protein [Parazoarcus communis]NMG71824.1 hypothetical protein [Parazoarcus communis SWub3 = DSM 12120]PZA14937.1 hypothetical protein DNK49_19015 [Azoarcus communis] [Parazoarcus communis SWub3 = DSM 12120]